MMIYQASIFARSRLADGRARLGFRLSRVHPAAILLFGSLAAAGLNAADPGLIRRHPEATHLPLISQAGLSVSRVVAEYPLRRGRYAAIVQEHVDAVLRHASDNFGAEQSPLIADTLDVVTKEPYVRTVPPKWSANTGHPERQITFNFAIYQQFSCLLRELSDHTGESKYRERDEEITRYALAHLQHESGLLKWGNHSAIELTSGRQIGGKNPNNIIHGGMVHELSKTAPDYEHLFALNPEAMRRQIESHWWFSITNWERLDFTRHIRYNEPPPKSPWGEVSRIDPDLQVPFGSKDLMSWMNAGNELIYSAFAYWKHTGDERAWRAGDLMLKRFMDVRNSETHLSPFTYGWCLPRPQQRKSWTEAIHPYRLHREPLFLLRLAQIVGAPRGDRLRILGIEALLAYARHLHIPKTNHYRTGLNLDGTVRNDRSAICPEMMLSGLALGYRVSGNPLLWDALRDIIAGYGMGDIGRKPGQGVELAFDRTLEFRDYDAAPLIHAWMNNESAYFIHAFVDLYVATGDQRYLQFAAKIADQLIDEHYEEGLFVRSKGVKWARTTGELLPMALLNLEAAAGGRELAPIALMPRILYYRALDSKMPPEMEKAVASSRQDPDFWLYTMER